MAYQLPTEIQHMIWTYSMYNSAKGLGFRKQIQEGWFKLRLRRLSKALETKSQDIYSGDSVFLYRFTVFHAFLSRLCHVRFECVTETFLKRKWRFKR